MPEISPTLDNNTPSSLEQLTNALDAMHLAQLSAFAFAIPQLYFCREYLLLEDKTIIKKCMQRLERGLDEKTFNSADLTNLLNTKEYFSTQEVRERLAPEPDFESLNNPSSE